MVVWHGNIIGGWVGGWMAGWLNGRRKVGDGGGLMVIVDPSL